MNLLPVVGLLAGFVIGDRRALLVTAGLAAIGLSLVAIYTEEIGGWGDPYLWGITIVALLTTILGINGRRWFTSRRSMRTPV